MFTIELFKSGMWGDSMDDHLELLLSGQLYKKLKEVVYKPVTKDYSLSMFDIKVLLFLKDHDMYDTARDIVEIHYLTKSYVSKSIDTLIEKGYLKRKQDMHDRRCIHLELQDKALPVIAYVKVKQQELLEILFNGITEEEEHVIRGVAEKISSNIASVLEESGTANISSERRFLNAGRNNG